jgi:integrase
MAKIRIAKPSVDAAKPGLQDALFWDDQLKGFGLKVTPKGKKVYVCQYRVGGGAAGKTRRMTLGAHGALTPEQARSVAKQILGAAANGGDPAADKQGKRKQIDVAELCNRYLEGGCGTKKASTIATDRGRIERHIKPLLGRKKVADITRADIKRFLQDVATGKTAADIKTGKYGRARVTGGKGTASRTLGLLGGIFAYAIDMGHIEINPVHGVKRFADHKNDRFLSENELVQLGDALRQAVAAGENYAGIAIIRLLIFTGARKGEIESLKWREIDFERGLLRLEDSKTGQKIVALNAGTLEILAALPRIDNSEYVFPACKGESRGHFQGVPKVWRKVRSLAGLENLRLHDLRHSFASIAVSAGASLPIVGALLGHRDAATTQRYAHLSDDPVRSVSDAVSRRLKDALRAVA